MAQATAHGFEEVKPEPQAMPSPATTSQSLASEGSAWAGLQLSGGASTSLYICKTGTYFFFALLFANLSSVKKRFVDFFWLSVTILDSKYIN